jgi:hypothetical protein
VQWCCWWRWQAVFNSRRVLYARSNTTPAERATTMHSRTDCISETYRSRTHLLKDDNAEACLGKDGGAAETTHARSNHNDVNNNWQLGRHVAIVEQASPWLLLVDIR